MTQANFHYGNGTHLRRQRWKSASGTAAYVVLLLLFTGSAECLADANEKKTGVERNVVVERKLPHKKKTLDENETLHSPSSMPPPKKTSDENVKLHAPSSLPHKKKTSDENVTLHTPSSMPSSEPSTVPSAEPSPMHSSMPSSVPSFHPSASFLPTSTPSLEPSAPPSLPLIDRNGIDFGIDDNGIDGSLFIFPGLPTGESSTEPSSLPSSSPTPLSLDVDATVELSFPSLDQTMDVPILRIFEKETASFLSENVEYPGLTIVIETVAVVSQELIRGRNLNSKMNDDNNVILFPTGGNNFDRSLQQNSSSILELTIEVTGKVSPYNPPEEFSFSSILADAFAVNAASYNNALSEESTFFASLGESPTGPQINEDSGAPVGKVVGGVGVTVMLFVAAFFVGRNRITATKERSQIKELEVEITDDDKLDDNPEGSPTKIFPPPGLSFSKSGSPKKSLSSPPVSPGDLPKRRVRIVLVK
uniref:Uncharacterized protein n=1 Tax=Ditylum brightwellii TaxID=49249 RepID=A0A6U3UNN5_9STRA|mmetsp:Transcript_5698/g.8675  ORF Transcript_5698/g.8675 Transcript_5698/m.8675 type:complete len:476 (+) Transcript_5698:219-1646(+)